MQTAARGAAHNGGRALQACESVVDHGEAAQGGEWAEALEGRQGVVGNVEVAEVRCKGRQRTQAREVVRLEGQGDQARAPGAEVAHTAECCKGELQVRHS